jgi:hypothetical protein
MGLAVNTRRIEKLFPAVQLGQGHRQLAEEGIEIASTTKEIMPEVAGCILV